MLLKSLLKIRGRSSLRHLREGLQYLVLCVIQRITTGSTVSGGWQLGEPNDSGNNEDCGALVPGLGAGYNDADCTDQHDYVCECDGLAVMPLWCVTDTNSNCDTCGNSCAGTCNNQQCSGS